MHLVARMLDATDARPSRPRDGRQRQGGPTAPTASRRTLRSTRRTRRRGSKSPATAEDAPLGDEMPTVMFHHVLPRQPGQVAAAAPRIPAHRVRAVHQSAEAQLGPEGRVVEVALQLDRHPMLKCGRSPGPGMLGAGSCRPAGRASRQDPRPGSGPRRRSRRPRASPRHPRSPARSPSRLGRASPPPAAVPSAAARPGLASRRLPASTYSSSATTPESSLRSKTSRIPLSSTIRRGR